jgi:hypothetical protein
MPATTLQQLEESYHELWDRFVDPREMLDDDGESWVSLGADSRGDRVAVAGVRSEQELADVRAQCRRLAVSNEFAINGHENRVSYIVGTGHQYRAVARRGVELSPDLVRETQFVVDQFLRENSWHARQQEIVRRRDRDGEVFLRFFLSADGVTRVRFVEPGQIATPTTLSTDSACSFGSHTDPRDVETVLAYFVDGETVDANDVQHRKANVDCNVKRGLPLYYPVLKNLRRAEKLLRNMSTLAEIQSAIALIRRHSAGTRTTVQQFVADQADASFTSAATGRTQHVRRYAPGTVLDAPANVEYDFPASTINAASYVAVLQAELRAIASRLVMPEFMLTSDASNASYSSTMVAEGPAVKMFQRLQAEQIGADRDVLARVLSNAVRTGRLSDASLTDVEIQIEAPSLAVRQPLEEANVNRIEHAAGILSPQTWCLRRGLDYEREQENWRHHQTTTEQK